MARIIVPIKKILIMILTIKVEAQIPVSFLKILLQSQFYRNFLFPGSSESGSGRSQKDYDNRANQMNPNNSSYYSSREQKK